MVENMASVGGFRLSLYDGHRGDFVNVAEMIVQNLDGHLAALPKGHPNSLA